MSDLTAFLLARLDEDERLARRIQTADAGLGRIADMAHEIRLAHPPKPGLAADLEEILVLLRKGRVHMLADVQAKRAIIAGHARVSIHDPDLHPDACDTCGCADTHPTRWPCKTLRHLASVYSEHPDYRETWRP